jgi:hypothetical protein
MKPQTLMFLSALLVLVSAALNAYATYCLHIRQAEAAPLEVRQGGRSIDSPAECDSDNAEAARRLAEVATYAAAAFAILAGVALMGRRTRSSDRGAVQR